MVQWALGGARVRWMVEARECWVGKVCDRWSAGVMGGARECWVGTVGDMWSAGVMGGARVYG